MTAREDVDGVLVLPGPCWRLELDGVPSSVWADGLVDHYRSARAAAAAADGLLVHRRVALVRLAYRCRVVTCTRCGEPVAADQPLDVHLTAGEVVALADAGWRIDGDAAWCPDCEPDPPLDPPPVAVSVGQRPLPGLLLVDQRGGR